MSIGLRGFALGVEAANADTTINSGVFDVDPVTGDVIKVFVLYARDTSENVTGVTDSQSNTYVATGATFSLGGGLEGRSFIAHNVTGAAAMTVTATFSASGSTICVIFAVAVSGAHASAAVDLADDATQVNPGITANALTTGNLGTPSESGEMVLAVSFSGSGQDGMAPGTGWTEIDDISFGNIHGMLEYQIQGSPAAATATWTLEDDDGVGTFGMLLVSLKAAAGGGGKVSKNIRSAPLGLALGIGVGIPGPSS